MRAKEFRYAVSLDRAGRMTAEGQGGLDLDPAWKPEHLVLAGLARCTLESLRFHAARASVDLVAATDAAAVVTRRAPEERYAFAEIDVRIDLEVDPVPPADELQELLALAERDCFVGASLRPPPRYYWRVNGETFGF